jgi:hypothetical protein
MDPARCTTRAMPPATDQRRIEPGAIHIAALWALAVAGPTYDVLRQSAEFFVAYRVSRLDLGLFVVVVSFLAPLALWSAVWVLGRLSRALGESGLTAILALLVTVFAAQAFQSLAPPMWLHLAMAVGAGLLAAALYAYPATRTFTTFLAPAIVLFPGVFLLDPAIRPFVWPRYTGAAVPVAPPQATPIVFVVFDQLPLTSLLGTDGTIDGETYPGLAELAGTSTWYREATTVGELTAWALPPIVSGRLAGRGQLPTAADYPNNLFTALGQTYQMQVFEPLTNLCPDAICPPSASVRDAPRLRPMLADAAVVWAHRVLPPRLAAGLPPVDENWRGFADAQGFDQQWAAERETDRRRDLDNFVEAITSTNPPATLYFLHALLPHEPYVYLPSGQVSGRFRQLPGLSFGRWTSQEWPVAQAYARHLLQVGFVDRFVQRLTRKLREEGLFDRALIVITSDHGVSFAPGASFKAISRETQAAILRVPLIVKQPGQQAAAVSDRNVQAIDVLPLVADLLEVALPFATEGRSPRDAGVAAPATKTVVQSGGRSRLTLALDDLQPVSDVVTRRVRWFGTGAGPHWSPIVAPAFSLVGRPLGDLRVESDSSLAITLDVADELTALDLHQPWVPAVLAGRVRGLARGDSRLPLAVAVNGRIAATTETYAGLGSRFDGTWSALVNPSAYRSGFNDVRVYAVRGAGADVRLVEGFRTRAK